MYIRMYLAILLIVLWFLLDVTEGMNSGLHSPDPMMVISVLLLIVIIIGIPILKGLLQIYDDD